MGKEIYVVYETDQWHTISTREDKGVFSSRSAAVNAIVKNHTIDLDEFFDGNEQMTDKQKEKEVRRLLRNELKVAWQTQGYSTNYEIEAWHFNEWYN